MNEIWKFTQEIREISLREDIHSFPYENLYAIQKELESEFKKYVPNESICADLNTYWMYIAGLSSGGIDLVLYDPLEIYKTRLWLEKSFFDWFPKYRFLEKYDFSDFKELDRDFKLYNKLRHMLLNVIKLAEQNNSGK